MRDHITIERVAKLHPAVRAEVTSLIDKVEANMMPGKMIRVVQGLRTIEEQDALYAKGRTTPGPKVTNAKGGSSYHNYGLAIDYAVISGGQVDWNPYQPMIDAFKAAGWEWGGDFKSIVDKPHFQKTFGKTVKQLKALYVAGGYPPV